MWFTSSSQYFFSSNYIVTQIYYNIFADILQKIFKPKKTAKSSIQSLCHTVHRSLPVPCFRAPLRRHVLPPYCAPCCAGLLRLPTARPVLLPRCAPCSAAPLRRPVAPPRYSTNWKIRICAVFLGGQVQHKSENQKMCCVSWRPGTARIPKSEVCAVTGFIFLQHVLEI